MPSVTLETKPLGAGYFTKTRELNLKLYIQQASQVNIRINFQFAFECSGCQSEQGFHWIFFYIA